MIIPNKPLPLKSNKEKIQFSICLIITLVMYGFFSYRQLNVNSIKLSNMLLALGTLLFSVPMLLSANKYQNAYTSYIRGIVWITVFSIFSSWLFWGQSIILGYRATSTLLFISLFFVVLKCNIPLAVIEKYILFFGVAYCVAWIIGIITMPTPIFGNFNGEESGIIDESRGMVRMSIPGKSLLVLAYFLSLTKFSYERKKVYILGAIVFFFFIVLQLVRQIMFFSFAIGVLFMLTRTRLRIYFLAFLIIAYFSGVLKYITNNQIVKNLIELTDRQLESNQHDEDTRIKEYKFYFTGYTKDAVAVFVGNGMPHSESNYGQVIKSQNAEGYYMSDVGYAMMYVVTGIIGLLFYLVLFILCSLRDCQNEYMFAKLFIMYFVFTNIIASWYATIDGIICICICVYLLGNDYYLRNTLKRLKL